MATSKKKKPAEEAPAKRDAPTAAERKESPRTKKVAPKRAPTYTVTLVEGTTLKRKGFTFAAGRPTTVDEATYRLFESNGRFRCASSDGEGG